MLPEADTKTVSQSPAVAKRPWWVLISSMGQAWVHFVLGAIAFVGTARVSHRDPSRHLYLDSALAAFYLTAAASSALALFRHPEWARKSH